MFRDASTPEPEFTDTLALDLDTVAPSLAGPKRPQDRVLLSEAEAEVHRRARHRVQEGERRSLRVNVKGEPFDIGHGDVVIAAITSCTNTSNPYVMIGAGPARPERRRARASRPSPG